MAERLTRSTQNLWKRAAEICQRPHGGESPDFSSSHGSAVGAAGSTSSSPDSAPALTREYPAQGKLADKPCASVEYTDWEPAESLNIAIVVGPDELASGILRNQFTTLRGQRHEALVYRWQDNQTFDVIAIDLRNHGAADTVRIDILMLSDQILGPAPRGAGARELERAALAARLRFPDTYLVGVSQDSSKRSLLQHPFSTVEHKARKRAVKVFDERLVGLVTQDTVTGLLVAYARSDRYAPERCVWAISPQDGVPLPVPKSELHTSLRPPSVVP
ncbi:MAG: hypothetical protein ABI333_20095 [bacterium]